MSPNNHREVARLDRVPLPVEAARVGATGWQITRTGARVVTKLIGRGSLQQKVVKQIPQAFSDLGPTYVKLGQIIASSPGAFGEPLSRGQRYGFIRFGSRVDVYLPVGSRPRVAIGEKVSASSTILAEFAE